MTQALAIVLLVLAYWWSASAVKVIKSQRRVIRSAPRVDADHIEAALRGDI